MRLDEKRKVVEVLLCGTDWCGPNLERMTDWFDSATIAAAVYRRHSISAITPMLYLDIEFDTGEAAYRLIESSAVLIREFFARSES